MAVHLWDKCVEVRFVLADVNGLQHSQLPSRSDPVQDGEAAAERRRFRLPVTRSEVVTQVRSLMFHDPCSQVWTRLPDVPAITDRTSELVDHFGPRIRIRGWARSE